MLYLRLVLWSRITYIIIIIIINLSMPATTSCWLKGVYHLRNSIISCFVYPLSDQTEVGEWGGVSLQRHGWDLPVLSSVLRWSGSEELLSLWLQVMDVACRWLEFYINSQLCHCIKCSVDLMYYSNSRLSQSLSGCGPMFYVYSSVLVNSVCNSGSGAERPLTVHKYQTKHFWPVLRCLTFVPDVTLCRT